jgi:hypothetical protein
MNFTEAFVNYQTNNFIKNIRVLKSSIHHSPVKRLEIKANNRYTAKIRVFIFTKYCS